MMTLRRISQEGAFAVHTYFHVCPESLDGRKVAYTLFPEGPRTGNAGPGTVMVCDPDGANQTPVGAVPCATHHRGAVATWLDATRLAYEDAEAREVHVVDVYSGARTVYPGGIDNYVPALQRIYYNDQRPGQQAVRALDLATGRVETIVELGQMERFGPLGSVSFSEQTWRFAHAYVSPNGQRLAFAIFNGAPQEAFVFLATPDGCDVRLFGPKPMHWTFFDDDSLFGHDDKRDLRDKHMRRWALDGGILETLSGPGCHGAVSPDRRWVVTESWYGSDPVEIYLYGRGEVAPRRVLGRMAGAWRWQAHVHPAFSRDGRRVYINYNAPGGPGSQVYCCEPEELVTGG